MILSLLSKLMHNNELHFLWHDIKQWFHRLRESNNDYGEKWWLCWLLLSSCLAIFFSFFCDYWILWIFKISSYRFLITVKQCSSIFSRSSIIISFCSRISKFSSGLLEFLIFFIYYWLVETDTYKFKSQDNEKNNNT